MGKTLVIGDLHLKQKLGYSDYVEDKRIPEYNEVLDFIVEQSEDCDRVVLMGDNFNERNPTSKVVKELTNFIERFGDKEVIIIAGNHEIKNDGSTAIDYLGEVKGKNWKIVNNDIKGFNANKDLEFIVLPYMTRSKLGVETNDEAVKEIMKKIGKYVKGFKEKDSIKVLFHHHAMTGTFVQSGQSVNDFPEPVIPLDKLKKDFDIIVGGHIHMPKQYDKKVIVTGSVFNNEVGETGKSIWKIDGKKIEEVELPGRKIYKLENPTIKDLDSIDKNGIIKVVITKKMSDEDVDNLKKELKKFDAYIFLEQIPKKRKKLHYGEGESLLEFSMEDLLEVYAKEQKIDHKLLKRGLELISN